MGVALSWHCLPVVFSMGQLINIVGFVCKWFQTAGYCQLTKPHVTMLEMIKKILICSFLNVILVILWYRSFYVTMEIQEERQPNNIMHV